MLPEGSSHPREKARLGPQCPVKFLHVHLSAKPYLHSWAEGIRASEQPQKEDIRVGALAFVRLPIRPTNTAVTHQALAYRKPRDIPSSRRVGHQGKRSPGAPG